MDSESISSARAVARLNDERYFRLVMGQSPPGSTYNECGQGLPFFQGKTDFGEESPTPRVFCSAPSRIAEPNDVLISVRAPVGPTNLADRKCAIGRGLAAIRCKEGVAPRYLLMVLRAFEANITHLAEGQGGGFTCLRKDQLAGFEVPIPPVNEQRRIVARVEALTSRLDQARQARHAALAETKMFIYAKRCELLRTTRGAKESRFEDLVSETRLGIDRSRAQQSPEHSWAYLKMNNITARGTLDLETVTRIEATPAEAAKFTLREGDFLFNTRNSFELVGKTAVWRRSRERFLFNNNIMRIRFREGVNPRFVNAAFVSPIGERQLLAFKKQTTSVCAIYWKNLKEVRVPIPSPPEQRRIVELLEALEAELGRLQRLQLEVDSELGSFTPALLAKAFRGEF